MIHAMEGAPVCEVALSPWWRRRIAGAFRVSARVSLAMRRDAPTSPLHRSEADRWSPLMATLALAAAGAAVGGALLPAGVTLFGATLTGAALGPRSARSPAPSSTRRCSPPPAAQRHARPAPVGPARHRLLGRRADPPPLRPRAARRPDHLGDQPSRRRWCGRAAPAAAARAARARGVHLFAEHRVPLFRQLRRRARRGRDQRLGRVWADGRELDLSQFA